MASALMSLGTRAMSAAMSQLQVTGHNIANAGVDGYSRQSAELATSEGQFTGAGFFGKGVDVVTVQRAHDAFLTREAAAATSFAALDKTRHDMLVRLENAFPTGEQGIGYAAGQFLNAMVDLASRPQDTSTREVVLARAQEVAARFSLAAQQIETLQAGVRHDLKADVARVNELAGHIAEVNQRIASLKGLGHDANDLLDERDRLVKELSGFVAVTTIPADDGTLGVFVAGGQRLVLSNQAQQLAVIDDPLDPSRSAIGIVEGGTARPLSSALLEAGGAIGGLLKFQNDDLVAARTSIVQMAQDFADAVNDQQARGLDLRDPPGAGGPIFEVLPGGGLRLELTDPRGIAAASPLVATADPGNRGTGSVGALTMTGPKQSDTPVQIEFGDVVATTPQSIAYTWTRGADGGSGTWTPGQPLVIEEFSLTLNGVPQPADYSTNPPRKDKFTVEPTPNPASNNGNALALAALRDAKIVNGETITDAYASAMAEIGVRVQSAGTAAKLSASVQDTAEKQRQSVAGVNLDEEAARLIQFQQSYQAAAKVLQVAQQVFDTLLSVAAR